MKKSLVLSLVLAIPALGDYHAEATKDKVALPSRFMASHRATFSGKTFALRPSRKITGFDFQPTCWKL
jgi:hypothetical protein|tara:strand:+ start:1562 stop:1765 length:204 start_codon:yes stop_codon:yes gene_type:complete